MRLARTHTCPWWLTPTFDHPLRRWLQDPDEVLEPVTWRGARVLDLGCGMGFFTIPAARRVGPEGRVHAVDLQRRSLDAVARRARKAGVGDRLRLHCLDAAALELSEPIDAAYAVWMLHEVRDLDALAARLAALLPRGGPLLVAEPKVHVSGRRFDGILRTLGDAGFHPAGPAVVRLSRAALLVSGLAAA